MALLNQQLSEICSIYYCQQCNLYLDYTFALFQGSFFLWLYDILTLEGGYGILSCQPIGSESLGSNKVGDENPNVCL